MMLKNREPEPVKVSRYVIGQPSGGLLRITRYDPHLSPDGEVPWETYWRMEKE